MPVTLTVLGKRIQCCEHRRSRYLTWTRLLNRDGTSWVMVLKQTTSEKTFFCDIYKCICQGFLDQIWIANHIYIWIKRKVRIAIARYKLHNSEKFLKTVRFYLFIYLCCNIYINFILCLFINTQLVLYSMHHMKIFTIIMCKTFLFK